MSISAGTIRRRYDQGLDSIVRLVTGLEDRIEDLIALHVSEPQRTIRAPLRVKSYSKPPINKLPQENYFKIKAWWAKSGVFGHLSSIG